jgi:hypothetical protein
MNEVQPCTRSSRLTKVSVTPTSLLDSHEIAKPSVICPALKRVDFRLTMKPLRQYAADSRNRFEQREESIFAAQFIQHPPVVTKVRSAVGRWTPAASRPARARYRPDAY